MPDAGTIRCSPPESWTRIGTLPVRVRTASGTVVAEGVSGREITVPTGVYYVSAILPDGGEVVSGEPVSVAPGDVTEAVLERFEQRPAGSGRPDTALVFDAPAPPQASSPGLAGDAAIEPAAIPGTLQLTGKRWRGDWLAEGGGARDMLIGSSGFTGEIFTLAEAEPLVLKRDFGNDDVLIFDHDGRKTYCILPLDECVACADAARGDRTIEMCWRSSPDGPMISFASQVSPDMNAILEFVNHGLLAESRAVSVDLIMQGEAAMSRPETSLLQAVLGAYVLLRANRTEGLDQWIDRLVAIAPGMPDAYALKAETCARLGRHQEAIDALRAGRGKGCPWFRSGLSYMLERLRLYIDVHREKANSFLLSGQDFNDFVDLKAKVERCASHLNTGQVFTTFVRDDRPR
jgi:hypothetical protein